jgi:hypothetical protein
MIKLKDILNEAKEPHVVYHNSYSSAVQEAEKLAQKRGFEVDEDDWSFRVATGPKKPSEGKTNRFVIALTKKGKPNNSTLSFQVYGRGNGKYELNAYLNVSNKRVK